MRMVLALSILLAVGSAGPAQEPGLDEVGPAVVAAYASGVHALYSDVVERARALDAALTAFVSTPTAETLAAARERWIEGRRLYGQTEVFRFYDGPIDSSHAGVETLLNAWPLDEAYVDVTRDSPAGGIIQDTRRFPQLGAATLTLANERGGEANVCIGWHAIEFLLWGQDFSETGPGTRSHEDFVVGSDDHAVRRGEYLTIAGSLLVTHLEKVRDDWAPGAPYRRTFEGGAWRDAVRKILTGMVVLSGFEMAGERMAVAYETRDQEEEHSCFSDTTHIDYVANQLGIIRVLRGDPSRKEPGLLAVARAAGGSWASDLTQSLDAALAALRKIPTPFDHAIRAPDGSPAREAILEAIRALETQADTLAAFALALGFEVPLTPSGS